MSCFDINNFIAEFQHVCLCVINHYQANICLKSILETIGKGVKYVQG